MGKNVTKKRKPNPPEGERKPLKLWVLALLVLVGVGAIAGMAALNGSVKPDRDMRWYVREGAVQVAAPAAGDGFDTTEAVPSELGLGALEPVPLDGGDDAPAVLPAIVTDAPTAVPTPTPLPTPTPEPTATLEPTPTPPTEPVTITLTAAGDCTLGGDTNKSGYDKFKAYVKKYGYDYFFNRVRPIFEADDLTIVNLEGPLTTSKSKRSGREFNFKGDPDFVAILSGSGIDVCNVANNHSLDFGKAGLQETSEVLERAGIGCSGYFKAYTTNVKGVRVCSLGFTEWDYTVDEMSEAIRAARADCDLLIVSVHWGEELEYNATSTQRAMGRAAIDAGADLVLGTHPHVISGIEKYYGKYIVYSLGNFCFGGNSNPKDKRCLVFQQAFTFTPGEGISDAGINLIPASVSSTANKNDFQPQVMNAADGAKLLAAVAGYSSNVNMADILWLPDSFAVTNGLMPQATAVPDDLTWEERLNRDT